MPRYAAIDIGSNSVRMQAAEVVAESGRVRPARILASERQVTRLGEGVFREGRINHAAMKATCEVLARMAETYHQFHVAAVRAVATSAVRDAQNQLEFLERASEALGERVECISGREESRLIHLGVQSRWPHPDQRLLVLDIGGGSAEIIIGENGRMVEAFSKPLGAVRLTEVFLASDPPSPIELHRMESFIEEKVAAAVERTGNRRPGRAIATSATAAAVVCTVHHLDRDDREEADRQRVSRSEALSFYQEVRRKDLAARRKIPGIGPRRAEIIIAGAAVFAHVMRKFGLSFLYYSAAGVRDGIISDLASRGVGRELSRLSKDQRRVLEEMARRYQVSIPHARKVAALGHSLFDSLHSLHGLPPDSGKLLEAAAYLHDIGHFVSDTGHHKHSYYVVANSDLPGFTDRERELIANLCRYHRKAPPKPGHEPFQALAPDERKTVNLLMPLLRLADSLDRSHEQRVEQVRCHINEDAVVLELLSATDTDLEQWAAERIEDLFREVFGRPLKLARVTTGGAT